MGCECSIDGKEARVNSIMIMKFTFIKRQNIELVVSKEGENEIVIGYDENQPSQLKR